MDNYMLTHNTDPADSSDTEDWSQPAVSNRVMNVTFSHAMHIMHWTQIFIRQTCMVVYCLYVGWLKDMCSFGFPTVQGVVIIAVLTLNQNYRDTE